MSNASTAGGTWSINNGGIIDPNTGEIDLELTGGGDFIINYTVGTGACMVMASESLAISTLPIIEEIIISDETCIQNNGSIVITASADTDLQYSIDGVDFQNNNTFSNLGSGQYIVTLIDQNNCQITQEVDLENVGQADTIEVLELTCNSNEVGVFETMGVNDAGCERLIVTTVNLANSADCEAVVSLLASDPLCINSFSGSIALSIENGTAPFSYEWMSSADGVGMGIINSIEELIVIEELPEGTYWFSIVTANGFSILDTIELVPPPPIEVMFDLSNYNNYAISCEGNEDGSITIMTNNSIEPIQYQWSTGQTDQHINNLPSGWYEVSLTDANGCQAVDSVELVAPPAIELKVETTPPTCIEGAKGSIRITSLNGGNLPFEYSFDGENFESIGTLPYQIPSGFEAGSYTIHVQDVNDCMVQETAIVSAAEEYVINLGESQSIELGDSIQLVPEVNFTPDGFKWEGLDSSSCRNCFAPFVSPTETTLYRITAFDENACEVTANILILVEKPRDVYIPNIFSPDDDGDNDVFTLYADLNEVKEINFLYIFDRWGNLVFSNPEPFQASNENLGWDGQFEGQDAQVGVYTYYTEVTFIDGFVQVYKGDITLIR